MASKCTPGTTGDALLRRSSAQLQTLLQTLAAVASGEAGDGSEKEEEAASVSLTPATRKGNKRRRFRSRNSVLDHWLADDKVSVSDGSVLHGSFHAVSRRRTMRLTTSRISYGNLECHCRKSLALLYFTGCQEANK
jgi:hypothetical protein